MTSYIYLSILLASTVVSATTFRKNSRNTYDDDRDSYSSFGGSAPHKGQGYVGGEGRSSQNTFNNGYDGDDYSPPVGVQHNNDYSGLGDGFRDYNHGGNEGNGAISYSHVVSEHRPAQRYQATQRSLKVESTNVIEKPVPFPVKVQFPVVPSYDRPILPLVSFGQVTPAVIAPVKYPVQFFKPFSYLTPEKHSASSTKIEQPEYVLTKVPLVYHASYSDTPLGGQSALNHGAINASPIPPQFNHGSSNFNHVAPTFNHAANNFHQNSNPGNSLNHGAHFNLGNNFNHGNHFNHGNTFNSGHTGFANINPVIATPGTPSFNQFNHVSPPIPLVPTPTPYHHPQRH